MTESEPDNDIFITGKMTFEVCIDTLCIDWDSTGIGSTSTMKCQFDQFELDTSLFRLTRLGKPISLKPLVFDLLAYLVKNRDRIVSRTELLDELWAGKVVTDAALAARIKDVRKALQDKATQQKIIRTIHRRGYQFVAELIEDSGHPPQVPQYRNGKPHFPGNPVGQAIDRRAAARQFKRRSRAGVFQRWNFRGHHHRAFPVS